MTHNLANTFVRDGLFVSALCRKKFEHIITSILLSSLVFFLSSFARYPEVERGSPNQVGPFQRQAQILCKPCFEQLRSQKIGFFCGKTSSHDCGQYWNWKFLDFDNLYNSISFPNFMHLYCPWFLDPSFLHFSSWIS